jgi:hypothetical protein
VVEKMNEDKPSNMKNIIIVAVIIILGIFAYFIAKPPLLPVFPENLSVSPDPLYFNISTWQGYQTYFSISNSGGGTLSWNLKADQPWIEFYPERGTGSRMATISINTGKIVPGKYQGNITVTSNGGVKNGTVYLNLIPALPRSIDGTSVEKITMAVGETRNIGSGWSVQANAIDSKATPKQVWLTLFRNGFKVDDKVLSEGETYNYNYVNIKIASINAGAVSDTVTYMAYEDGR